MAVKMKNIFIIGAQCTGKTTLVNALEKQIAEDPEVNQPVIIREVARTVLKEGNYTREDILNAPERAIQLQSDILAAQHTLESSIAESAASNWYISDRSGIDPIVYASVYVSPESAQSLLAKEAWVSLESNMKSGLVVLCEAGCDWLIDDGTRLMPRDKKEWDDLDDAFREMLSARSIPYVVLPRTLRHTEERVAFVERLRKLGSSGSQGD